MAGFLMFKNKIISKPNNLSEGLISYWSFDSNANDNHRNNNGSITGATGGQTGILNDCYYFDGTDDYIRISDDDFVLSDGSPISVNIWLKISQIEGVPISAFQDPYTEIEAGFGIYNNNRWYMGDGTNWKYETAGLLTNSEWNMYTMTYDGDKMKVYRNNSLLNTSSSFTAKYETYNGYLSIGEDNRYGNKFFEGYIDEVGIWEKTLSEKEISYLYNNGDGLNYNKFRYGNI